MSVELDLTIEGLEEADARLALLDPLDSMALLEGLARLIQEQTRRRIEEEKTDPDGNPWKPNLAGTSILYKSGAMARAIDYQVSGNSVRVGVGAIGGVPYPAVHQGGATIRPKKAKSLVFKLGNRIVHASSVTIPARPFLGISGANSNEILETVADYIRRKLG